MITKTDEVVKEGIKSIADRLAVNGISLNITDAQIEVIGKGLIALIDVINESSIKKAEAAGQAGADGIKTVDDANAIMKAIAESEAKR